VKHFFDDGGLRRKPCIILVALVSTKLPILFPWHHRLRANSSAGNFGYFTLDLSIQGGKNTPATNYPVTLSLKQTGSANLDLVPVTDSFNVDSVTWHDSTRVNINIPASVASNPSFQVDGSELVANLQMVTPNRSNLDTVTTIQVHLRSRHRLNTPDLMQSCSTGGPPAIARLLER
jgi:hypothetical protein